MFYKNEKGNTNQRSLYTCTISYFFSSEAEKDEDNRMDIMFDRLMLMELRENVSKIDSKSFAELRSYNEPPKIVQNIVKAVVAIFHLEQVESGELDDWTNLRNVSYGFYSNF